MTFQQIYKKTYYVCGCCSVTQMCTTLCNPMDCRTPGFPNPSPSPGACSNSCLLSWWCHPTVASSVVPFSSHLQSFPTSGSFLMSRLLTSITIISNYIVYLICLLSVYSNLNVDFLKSTPCVFSFPDVSSASRNHLISIGKLKTN